MTSVNSNSSNNNNISSEVGEQQQQQQRVKKPSYVGLSCAVSGYSPFTRYTSPDGRRTSPSAIPVASNPQTLDSVALVRDFER